jgi:hypothetical protein
LRTSFHAAVVAFADAVEFSGIRNGQRAEHHRVDQRKHCGGPANSQGECEDRGSGKNGRQPELSQGVAKVAKEVLHFDLSVLYAGNALKVPKYRLVALRYE